MVNYVDQEYEFCPCACHEDGEPYCIECFEDRHVIDKKEVDA